MSVGPQEAGRGEPAARAAGAGQTETVRAEVTRLPAELIGRLAGAERPMTVEATVTGRGRDGSVQLRTPHGEMQVRAEGDLPAGRRVAVQIPPQPGLTESRLARAPIQGAMISLSGGKAGAGGAGGQPAGDQAVTVRLSSEAASGQARPPGESKPSPQSYQPPPGEARTRPAQPPPPRSEPPPAKQQQQQQQAAPTGGRSAPAAPPPGEAPYAPQQSRGAPGSEARPASQAPQSPQGDARPTSQPPPAPPTGGQGARPASASAQPAAAPPPSPSSAKPSVLQPAAPPPGQTAGQPPLGQATGRPTATQASGLPAGGGSGSAAPAAAGQAAQPALTGFPAALAAASAAISGNPAGSGQAGAASAQAPATTQPPVGAPAGRAGAVIPAAGLATGAAVSAVTPAPSGFGRAQPGSAFPGQAALSGVPAGAVAGHAQHWPTPIRLPPGLAAAYAAGAGASAQFSSAMPGGVPATQLSLPAVGAAPAQGLPAPGAASAATLAPAAAGEAEPARPLPAASAAAAGPGAAPPGPTGPPLRGMLQPLLDTLSALRTGLLVGKPSAGAGKSAPAPPPLPLFGTGPAGRPVPDALPSLKETLTALMQAQPGLGEQVVRQVVPQPNAMLGATLMFFLAALRGGDVRSWLGERAARALEQAGRGDLVGRLGGELTALARQAREPAGEFRPLLVPIYQEGEIEYLQLAVRRPPDDGSGREEGEGEAGKRFLIEVDLSRTGPLQLDGLVKAKRFHLIVRTHGPFPQAMRTAIREVFIAACEACGLQPSLAFQTGADAWVRLGKASETAASRAVQA